MQRARTPISHSEVNVPANYFTNQFGGSPEWTGDELLQFARQKRQPTINNPFGNLEPGVEFANVRSAPQLESPSQSPGTFSKQLGSGWDEILGKPGGMRTTTFLDPASGNLMSGQTTSVDPKDMTGTEFYRGMQGGMLRDPSNINLSALNRWLNVGHGAAGESRGDRERTLKAFMDMTGQGKDLELEKLRGANLLEQEKVRGQYLKDIEQQKFESQFGPQAQKLGAAQAEYARRMREGQSHEDAMRGANATASGFQELRNKLTPGATGTGPNQPPTPTTPQILSEARDPIVAAAMPEGRLDVNALLSSIHPALESGKIGEGDLRDILKGIIAKGVSRDELGRRMGVHAIQNMLYNRMDKAGPLSLETTRAGGFRNPVTGYTLRGLGLQGAEDTWFPETMIQGSTPFTIDTRIPLTSEQTLGKYKKDAGTLATLLQQLYGP